MRSRPVRQVVCAAALWSLLTVSALAQQTRVDPLVAAIDADSDGTISAAELGRAAAATRKLDTDGDGFVSRDEARGRGRTTAKQTAEILRR